VSVASLEALLDMLNSTPVIADLHPVSCCFLPSDVAIYETASELVYLLDLPTTTLPRRSLILRSDPIYADRYPHVKIDHEPFTLKLNDVLFERFDEIGALMLTQSQLSERIIEQLHTLDIIVLMLIDGLSYGDVRSWLDTHSNEPIELEPCLVDGPTLTEVAFPRILDDPPLAVHLLDYGYERRLGFTYWTRENNPLTEMLFRTISDVSAVSDFSTILESLRAEFRTKQKTYVQIVRMGLDGYAHHQKRKPPVAPIVDTIIEEMLALANLCRELEKSACIYLTADHGILWRDEADFQIIGRAPAGSSPRSCELRDLAQLGKSARCFAIGDRELCCLDYPKLRRPLRIDEQGVHGGVSFQESIVPFISYFVGSERVS
jgi:hypothetical protein